MEGTLSEVLLPCRKAAAQAARALADQLESTDDDAQITGSDKIVLRKGPDRAGKPIRTYGKRARAAARTTSPSTPARLHSIARMADTRMESSPQPSSAGLAVEHGEYETKSEADEALPIPKKAKMQPDAPEVYGDGPSDLSSVPSSTRAGSVDSEIEIVEDVSPAPFSFPSHFAGSSLKQLRSIDETNQRKRVALSPKALGSYVWVLIDPKTVRVYDPANDNEDCPYRLWWPGKITSSHPKKISLRVKLFKQKTVTINSPYEGNLLSKLDNLGRWRYTSPTFVSFSQQAMPSSRKESKIQRTDIELRRREGIKQKWKGAVEAMRQEGEEEGSDDLPDVGEMVTCPLPFMNPFPIPDRITSQGRSLQSKFNGQDKEKGKRKRDDLNGGSHDDAWEPPPPDDTLQIPGELVLGREGGEKGASAIHNMGHWPAKILGYVPPSHRKQVPKYRVKWLDGTEAEIPRSCFYSLAEEEFAICKLGVFESAVTEVADDDENEDIEASKAHWDFSRRSPSPEVFHPPPTMERFRELSTRLQFVHTKPVLKATLNEDYEPVMESHKLFVAGGPKRESLKEHSCRRGIMGLKQVEELTNYLKEWCLRGGMSTNTEKIDTDKNEEDTLNQGVVVITSQTEQREEEHILQTTQDTHGKLEIDDGTAIGHSGTEIRSLSPAMTDIMPASQDEVPPSSSFRSTTDHDSLIFESFTAPSPKASSNDFVPISRAPTEPLDVTGIDINGNSNVTDLDEDGTMHETRRLPRQKGCEGYEALADLEKLHYCTAVLLPECIRQILLWQTGLRTSIELLSPSEEQELYDKGEELLNETDWVFDIQRMRQRAERLRLQRSSNSTGRRRAKVDYCEFGD